MYSSVRGQVSAQQREHSQGLSKEWGLGCLELVMKSRGVPQMRAMHGGSSILVRSVGGRDVVWPGDIHK